MSHAGLTLPAADVGAWEGARAHVVSGPYRGGSGIVTRVCDACIWVRLAALEVSCSVGQLHLDLTHRPTRLEVMARAAARLHGSAPEGLGFQFWCSIDAREWRLGWRSDAPAFHLPDLDPWDPSRLPDGARVVDVRALALVAGRVFGGEP